MAPARLRQEESWDSLHRSEVSDTSDESYPSINRTALPPTPLRTVSDVQRALHPLQETADRVGKQVEKFAEIVDRMRNDRKIRKHDDCRDVMHYVNDFENVAAETVKRLKRYHDNQHQQYLSKSFRRSLRRPGNHDAEKSEVEEEEAANTKTTAEDLHHWERERLTWKLLDLMLQIEYTAPRGPPISRDPKYARPTGTETLTVFSSQGQVYDEMLDRDDEAWAKYVVQKWLSESAESTRPTVDAVIQELEGASQLWSLGWMHTKEAIKGQKRLRSWPQPLEPTMPGIHSNLISSDASKSLVTQLDPDAPSRQGMVLQPEDKKIETVLWQGCFELLRRGRSFEEIKEWCDERSEGWRAILLLKGISLDDTSGSWKSSYIWLQSLRRAVRGSDKLGVYEQGVYGILCGDYPSTVSVSTARWEDEIFARVNAGLCAKYENHARKAFESSNEFQRLRKLEVPRQAGDDGGFVDWAVLETAIKNSPKSKQSLAQLDWIQGSLILKQIPTLLSAAGRSLISNAQALQWPASESEPQTTGIQLSLEDYDTLRIMTHILLVLGEVEPMLLSSISVGQSVIGGYLDFLAKAGKQQLLPLYASCIPSPESEVQLGRHLPYITNSGERQTMVRLMQQYKFDVVKVVNATIDSILSSPEEPPDATSEFPEVQIIEPAGPRDAKAMKFIRAGFIGVDMNESQHDLIATLEWYLLIDGAWEEMMYQGARIYKHLLRQGGLAAARELARRIPFSKASLMKTPHLLGRSVDLSNPETLNEDGETTLNDPAPWSKKLFDDAYKKKTKTTTATARHLLKTSATFRDLEAFILAVDAMEVWQDAFEGLSSEEDVRHARVMKQQLQQCHDNVVFTMQPILQEWLSLPKDENEQREFDAIRARCLPELILAYISAHYFAGHLLSRDYLLECMELANTVAAPSGEHLVKAFTDARRMAELVDAFANAAKAMIKANEVGQRRAQRGRGRKGHGGDLGMWSIKTGDAAA